MTDVLQQHIKIVEKRAGPRACIAGTRIRVQDIVMWHERAGWSVDEIVDQYPHLTKADVHAALAYYWDHYDEIEREIAEDDAFVEELKRQQGSPLMEKLNNRQRG